MRLTLRTLLAWRDGLLSGPEKEELSARVTEGSVAQTLLDRMQAVEKRPDIEPPKVEGRGLGADANSVAEYLENVLDPENLEAFERICLESDRQLAEVSACHAVLAEATHRRLHGATLTGPLLKVLASRLAESAAAGRPTEPQPVGTKAALAARQPEPPQSRQPRVKHETPQFGISSEPATQPASAGQRRSRRTSPWLQVAVAVGLLCLAGGGLGFTLWRTSAVTEGRENVNRDAQPQPPVAEVQPSADTDEVVDVDAAGADAATQPHPQGGLVAVTPLPDPMPLGEDATADTERARPPQVVASAEARPADAEEDRSPEVSAVERPPLEAQPLGVGPSVPMGDALAIAAPLAPGPDALVPPLPAPEPPLPAELPAAPAQPAPPVGSVAEGPLVLVADREQPGQWLAGFAGEPLAAEVQLLAPPAMAPELDLGGVVVRLMPSSQVVLRRAEAADVSRVDVELVFGAVVVRRLSGEVEVDVRAGGLQWRLAGPPTAVVVQVGLDRQPGQDPVTGGFVTAQMAALETEAAWSPLLGSACPATLPDGGTLPAGTVARWSSVDSSSVQLEATAGGLDQDAWLPSDRLAIAAASQLAAAATERGGAIEAARGLTQSRRVELREVAAATLALVGDYTAAVALLCEEDLGERLGERRWRAFAEQVVPLALARGVHSAGRLRQAFITQLPGGEGERVYRLALGFSNADLAGGADVELVAALDDPTLVVRRYAAWQLEEIVEPAASDRLKYRADGAADTRAEGVRWWASQREKGLILRVNAEQLSGREPG